MLLDFVATGWETQCASFARTRFTEALVQAAQETETLLISLAQLEATLPHTP